ncbi:MAG: UPF0175 family protein [Candidatus Micrarchaeia archaeon]|jgi:predicted HTH domain antitoxin
MVASTNEKLRSVLALYKKEKISLGKAASMAGVSYDKMLDILCSNGIQPKLGPDNKKNAERELAKTKRLL